MADQAVKIRVSTTDETEMRRISAALAVHGFRLRRMLTPLGLLTGDVDRGAIDALRTCHGVEAVEPEGEVRLPPLDPDAPQ